MTMKRMFSIGLASAWLLAVPLQPTLAQGTNTRAEVIKIDRDGGRVTLKHAGIKNLDMPPMTMIFHVADASLLQGVAVGSRVRFMAERIEGRYTVTGLSRMP